MQNVRHITLEAVFLLGILSAKTGKVLSDGPIGNEEFVPAVFSPSTRYRTPVLILTGHLQWKHCTCSWPIT